MELLSPGELRQRRERLGLTQAELAERAGVSQPLIARVESGSLDPSMSTYTRVLEALHETERVQVEARDLMHTPVLSVSPRDSVRKAVELMRDRGFSQLPVIDEDVPVGSISESDVVHEMSVEGRAITERSVRDLMDEGFPTISPSTGIDTVSRILEHESALMVVERGAVVGVVTNADVMRVLE
ncbi:MAG: Zinc metalloprotease [Methanonatronarchaeales archaeon]|nr:Zinc metalloprotease [Methanonatronarchaeales archaeon]